MQYMAYMKANFYKLPDVCKLLLDSESHPAQAKGIYYRLDTDPRVSVADKYLWESKKGFLLGNACLARFSASDLKDDLLETGDKPIVVASILVKTGNYFAHDYEFGIGMEWSEENAQCIRSGKYPGQNLLGKSLEWARNFLRNDKHLKFFKPSVDDPSNEE